MKRFLFGFTAGALLTAVVGAQLLLRERKAKLEYGLYHGRLNGLFDAADALQKEFGTISDRDAPVGFKSLWSIKTTDVICFETNGIKTIRIIP